MKPDARIGNELETTRENPFRRWLPPAVLASAAILLFAARGPVWPDVLVDSGREVYVPWRLSRGAVLYRDIAYFNGPLSAYLHACLFRIFGVSLRVLMVSNCLVIAAVIVMLYALTRTFASRLAATLAGLTFIGLLAFNQITELGGYNWIFPYSHELTHGAALALASLAALIAYAQSRKARWLLASGAALGLAFLTKAEVFAAGAATNALMLFLLLPRRERPLRAAGLWALGSLLPVILAIAALATVLPLREAIAGACGAWRYVLAVGKEGQAFYRGVMGADLPLNRFMIMLGWAAGYILFFGFAAAICTRMRGRWAAGWIALAVFALGLALHLGATAGDPLVEWNNFALPLPVGMIAAAIYALRQWRTTRSPGAASRLGLAVLGLTLLAKIVLHVNIYHYGFGLAVVALPLAVAVLVGEVPGMLARRRPSAGKMFLAVVLAAWAALVTFQQMTTLAWNRQAVVTVGNDGDRIAVSPARGVAVRTVLEQLEKLARPGETLAVLPEGVMLNYLTRMENPTPYVNFMPVEFGMFGERRILAAFREHPPDYVALVDKDTSEYGRDMRRFGQGEYGRALFAWVLVNYEPVGTAGGRPFRDEGFGIMLLARRQTGVASR